MYICDLQGTKRCKVREGPSQQKSDLIRLESSKQSRKVTE